MLRNFLILSAFVLSSRIKENSCVDPIKLTVFTHRRPLSLIPKHNHHRNSIGEIQIKRIKNLFRRFVVVRIKSFNFRHRKGGLVIYFYSTKNNFGFISFIVRFIVIIIIIYCPKTFFFSLFRKEAPLLRHIDSSFLKFFFYPSLSLPTQLKLFLMV